MCDLILLTVCEQTKKEFKMKFLVVIAALIAAAAAHPAVGTWNLQELSTAIQDPKTDPAQLPYLTAALNKLMNGLVAGNQQSTILVSLPVTTTMTLHELSEALQDPSTNPALVPFYEQALNDLMAAMFAGQDKDAITLNIPAMNVNMWTMNELSVALQSPDTDPELKVYLEHALNELIAAMFAGEEVSSIAVVTPPGVVAVAPIIPVDPIIVDPAEIVDPMPVVVPEPELGDIVDPMPVIVPEITPAAPSSPLVQLIVNINAQAAAAPSPVAPVVVDQPGMAPLPAGPPLSVNPNFVPVTRPL